jgi:hypothetical protein
MTESKINSAKKLLPAECPQETVYNVAEMPSFLAIADFFLRRQSLKLGSTFIYGVRLSFESFSGVTMI